MAKASVKGTAVTILLELTIEEAETLLDVTRRIGGPRNSRREHTDSIASAILDTGEVMVDPDREREDVEEYAGGIFFKP